MVRMLLLLSFVGMCTAVGLAAHDDAPDGESVKLLGMQEIQEKLDGKASSVTFVEVTIEAGQAGLPHRHPGPGFVYVLEGEYELGIDDQPIQKFKAGEVFYEPTGCLHRVSRNPSAIHKTRLVAVVVHPRDAKEVATPEKTHP